MNPQGMKTDLLTIHRKDITIIEAMIGRVTHLHREIMIQEEVMIDQVILLPKEVMIREEATIQEEVILLEDRAAVDQILREGVHLLLPTTAVHAHRVVDN